MDTGVEKDPTKALSIISPQRTVDWDEALFGDQLAFKCSDVSAQVSGPSLPTCVASGDWLPEINAGNKVECKCPTAHFMKADGACEKCPANTYSSEPGAVGSCEKCDQEKGETALPGSATCTRAKLDCPDGTYQDVTKSSCLSCLKDGAICEGNEITLLEGWWFDTEAVARSGKEISGETEIFMCLNPDACATDVGNITVSCNYGYSGVLCGACDLEEAGYMRSGQICRKCDSFLYNVIFVTWMGVIAIVYILYVIAFQNFSAKQNDQRGVVIKIAMSFCQMLTVLGVFKARGTALFNELVQRPASIAGGGFSSALPLKCLLNSQIYATFAVNMLTPIAACALTAVLIGPVWLLKRIQEAVRASYPPPHAPIEKVRVLCCCRTKKMAEWERKMWQQQRKEREAFQPGPRFIAVLVFVLFGIYPTLVKSIFSIFRCSELISGKSFLEDDYSVQCWVSYHPAYVGAAAGFACIYLFGIPLGLFAILRINRHRLNEPRFMATFGFVYNGYDTNRGLVVAWESFVMLRKLAVTAITVSSSDPYIQIFVALLLLIVSYGMQERVMPFETTLLNNIEGMGLFSLIFTQIVSILYLYIDSRAEATGKKDKVLEYAVTVILMSANCAIALAMTGAYLLAFAEHQKTAQREYHKFIEERDEPYGILTRHRNPRAEVAERLQVFRTREDCSVRVKPMLSSEKTGETTEEGKSVLVSQIIAEYVTPRPCKRGREIAWLQLSDGTGWILDTNLHTGEPAVELIGHREDDGTIERMYLRFETKSAKPVPIRAGTSSFPFVWPTGEFVMPKELFLVDMRFVRSSRCCCFARDVTYLHLADRRGWIVEPSCVPDVDWIDEPNFVDHSVLVKVTATETHVSGLSHVGVCEYDAAGYDVPIYAKDTWPPAEQVGIIAPGTRFFVDDRSHVFTRLRFMYISFCGYGERTICCPRSLRACRRVGRFATFVKLSDGSGYVLTKRRVDDVPLVHFTALRTDSVGLDSRSMLRWRYRANVRVAVHRSATAAVASMLALKNRNSMDLREIDVSNLHFYADIVAGTEISISTRRVIKPKLRTKEQKVAGLKVTVGEIERGAGGEGMGWIVLAPVGDDDLELLGVEIGVDEGRAYAVEQARIRAKKERKRVLRELQQATGGLFGWWTSSGIARGDAVVHPNRGPGVVVAVSPENDEKVHIEFASSSEVHRYGEESWGKLTLQDKLWWTRRWNGGIAVGTSVTHCTRGAGVITALGVDNDKRIHIKFQSGEVHRYTEHSWSKLSRSIPAQEDEATADQEGGSEDFRMVDSPMMLAEMSARKNKKKEKREARAAKRAADRDEFEMMNPIKIIMERARRKSIATSALSESADASLKTATVNPMQKKLTRRRRLRQRHAERNETVVDEMDNPMILASSERARKSIETLASSESESADESMETTTINPMQQKLNRRRRLSQRHAERSERVVDEMDNPTRSTLGRRRRRREKKKKKASKDDAITETMMQQKVKRQARIADRRDARRKISEKEEKVNRQARIADSRDAWRMRSKIADRRDERRMSGACVNEHVEEEESESEAQSY